MSVESAPSNAQLETKTVLITSWQDHFSMRYSGFIKNRSCTAKAHSFVETDYRNLGVKINLVRIVPVR